MTEKPLRPEVFHQARERIRRGMVERGIPSLAIAVAQGNTLLWEEGFGWADRERRIVATPHTLYSLASISKPITATALMILKERGLLDLDHPINDYLGDSKLYARVGNVEEATVRRVANHTAGLPVHYQFFYQDEPYLPPSMSETIRRYGNLVTAPGERFLYSNLGYGLLSEVIARLSGKSYANFLREEVFLPLGMLRASVQVGPGLEPFQAQRYGPGGVLYPFYDNDHPGASAVYCSAHDLMRFCMLHLKQPLPDQKAILSEETLDEMQIPTAQRSALHGYGIGWNIYNEIEDHCALGHGGNMDGVNTLLKMVPAARIAVAILTNTNGNRDLEEQIVTDILSVLLPTYAEESARVKERKKLEQSDEQTEEFRPDVRLLGRWYGHVHTYEGDIPFTLWFKETGDVQAQLGTQLKTLVNKVQFKEQYFTGAMMGDIGTQDARRYPHYLQLDLKQREDRFTGAMIALSDREKTPGNRFGSALNHWVELRKDG
ncbi:class A beta-lactamase-related serine hydrolase [Ktedonosporobacter rubrisoli]|uniref:Class A beta-lactamase-related serine hydrolase n=1 Tax=Ktedonosporobacter rubrisoli TaxID=2509675 RepID=A0A4V0YY38_KTERU|nr:serine hydrolase domain-containing protein [Ktedonosporobacter rubrisoli]QBD74871.1 class A beta-lactamase-related serine hydrolase [Ktedonosporobacter rubrisoli]